MTPPLPTPGHLILDNITLLSGSPTAFHDRYAETLTATSFQKPGNHSCSNAILHFLLTVIDPDVADTLFKPCFPILDRDQQRDFRRVVESRLHILERTNLLPVGSSRKAVLHSAGGDRFIDLLWSLSSLAVQQACLRHPAYASVSRIRLITHHARSSRHNNRLQHTSSSSSITSLPSSSSSSVLPTSAAASNPPHRQRRFLGVGLLTAAQQRANNAHHMRIRIDAERAALARTTDMGKNAAKTWGSEAESLRNKIGDFEAKLRRLKAQLADLGFDENGMDLRSNSSLEEHQPAASHLDVHHHHISDELKTSPIESTESGSSVDELLEPVDACNDITADLSTLLSYTADTRSIRADVDRALLSVAPSCPSDVTPQVPSPPNPEHIVTLMRATTDELELATTRMDQICEARRKASQQPSVGDAVEDVSLKNVVATALEKHNQVVEHSRSIGQEAAQLANSSRAQLDRLEQDDSDDSFPGDAFVDSAARPAWFVEAAGVREQDGEGMLSAGKKRAGSSKPVVDTAKDFSLAAKALSFSQSSSPTAGSASSKASVSGHASRRKGASTSLDSFYLSLQSSEKNPHASSRYDTDVVCTPSSVGSSSKTPRSVRFAKLPPSYSANRVAGEPEGAVAGLETRTTTERFPVNSSLSSPNDDDMLDDEGGRIADDGGRGDIAAIDQEKVCNDPSLSRMTTPTVAVDQEKYFVPRRVVGKKELCAVPGEPSRTVFNRRGCGEKQEEVPVKMEPVAARRMDSSRRASQKQESGRHGSVSSQKPPRLQRTQTPRRIVRQKEAIQRSALPNSRSSSSLPTRPRSSRSLLVRSATADSMRTVGAVVGQNTPGKKVDVQDVDALSATGLLDSTVLDGKGGSSSSRDELTRDLPRGNSFPQHMSAVRKGVRLEGGSEKMENYQPEEQLLACPDVVQEVDSQGLDVCVEKEDIVAVRVAEEEVILSEIGASSVAQVLEATADVHQVEPSGVAETGEEEEVLESTSSVQHVEETSFADTENQEVLEATSSAQHVAGLIEKEDNHESNVVTNEKAKKLAGIVDGLETQSPEKDSSPVLDEQPSDDVISGSESRSPASDKVVSPSVDGGEQAKIQQQGSPETNASNDDVAQIRSMVGMGRDCFSDGSIVDENSCLDDLADEVLSMEESIAGMYHSQDSVQKRLFMTPESGEGSSSKQTRKQSRLSGKKQGLMRKPSGRMFGMSLRTRGSRSGKLTGASGSPMVTSGDDDLLFSPAPKPPLPNKGGSSSNARASRSAGFFAGETAQWQQNVRSQKNAGNEVRGTPIERSSSDAGAVGRSSRGNGRGNASPKKSRVQAFRARLAALK